MTGHSGAVNPGIIDIQKSFYAIAIRTISSKPSETMQDVILFLLNYIGPWDCQQGRVCDAGLMYLFVAWTGVIFKLILRLEA